MLSGCAIINDEKQGAYFSQFSIPTKKLLGVGRCKSFENKYVENQQTDGSCQCHRHTDKGREVVS